MEAARDPPRDAEKEKLTLDTSTLSDGERSQSRIHAVRHDKT